MFRVDLKQLTTCCQQIKPIIKDWYIQIEELEHAINDILTLEPMDNVIPELLAERDNLEEEAALLIQLMEALDSSIRLYETTENRIVLNADGAIVKGKKVGIKPLEATKVDSKITGDIQPKIIRA